MDNNKIKEVRKIIVEKTIEPRTYTCEKCGWIGIYNSISEAKDSHDRHIAHELQINQKNNQKAKK